MIDPDGTTKSSKINCFKIAEDSDIVVWAEPSNIIFISSWSHATSSGWLLLSDIEIAKSETNNKKYIIKRKRKKLKKKYQWKKYTCEEIKLKVNTKGFGIGIGSSINLYFRFYIN